MRRSGVCAAPGADLPAAPLAPPGGRRPARGTPGRAVSGSPLYAQRRSYQPAGRPRAIVLIARRPTPRPRRCGKGSVRAGESLQARRFLTIALLRWLFPVWCAVGDEEEVRIMVLSSRLRLQLQEEGSRRRDVASP